jgi:serine/threonine-protein kinase RsbW
VGEIFSSVLVLSADLERLSVVDTQTSELMTHAPCMAEAESVRANIALAVLELCTNIVKHAYAGERGKFMLTLSLQDAPWRVEVITCDQGRCRFDAARWAPPDMDQSPVHGLGLFLMQSLMDKVVYWPDHTCTRWQMVKYLQVNGCALGQGTAALLYQAQPAFKPLATPD